MSRSALHGIVEALLFVSDEPMTSAKMARIAGVAESDVTTALRELTEEFTSLERGFQLREVAGGWQLCTHPAHHEHIEALVLSWDTRRLSQAALEALAVIAYHQPVTRQGVNAVRGVNSEGVIGSLLEKGLVKESGRDPNQGNAVLFATTRTFLEKFGLADLADLPPLDDFAPDPRTEKSIRERLHATEGPDLSDDAEELTVD